MTRTGVAILLLACVVAGCTDESSPEPANGVAAGCSAGEWVTEDGTCQPAGLPPDLPCPPGEWLDDSSVCIPAGVPPGGCAEGFEHDGDRGCVPVLPTEACPPGQLALPGEAVCHQVASCGSGPWGDLSVDGNTQFVDQSYTGGSSDGTQQHPWTTIGEGVSAAASGATVAVAAGSYVEFVDLHTRPVRLLGRCPELVEVVGPASAIVALRVRNGASNSEIGRLAVRGDTRGIALSGVQDVLVDRVHVHDNAGEGVSAQDDLGPTAFELRDSLVETNGRVGLFVVGSTATIEGSVVRGTIASPQSSGRGVSAMVSPQTGAPADLVVRRSLIDDNQTAGIYLSGATGTVEATVVRNTQLGANGTLGWGIGAVTHSTSGVPAALVVTTSVVADNHEGGIVVVGSTAQVSATVVRDTEVTDHDSNGWGVGLSPDLSSGALSTLELTEALIAGNRNVGVLVARSSATIDKTAIVHTQPTGQGVAGQGVVVTSDGGNGAAALLSLTSSVLAGNHKAGLFVVGADGLVSQSVVRDTLPDGLGRFGRGMAAQADPVTGRGSTLGLDSVRLVGNGDVGLFASGSHVTVRQSEVADTLPTADDHYGRGIAAEASPLGPRTVVELQGVLVERSHEAAVAVISSDATVEGCWLRDTSPSGADTLGDGVLAFATQSPAAVTITATRIDHSARAAIASFGSQVALGGARMTCQAFDLNGERYGDNEFTFTDLGGNLCGCPEAGDDCSVESSSLQPPAPVGGLE